jgi:hypothetical protein
MTLDSTNVQHTTEVLPFAKPMLWAGGFRSTKVDFLNTIYKNDKSKY